MDRYDRLIIRTAFVAAILSASGCQSTRMLTDLKPEQNPGLSTAAGTFYIAEIRHSSKGGAPSSYDEKAGQAILPVLRRDSMAAYPKLFTDNPSGSIPLSIDLIYEIDSHDLKNMAWVCGTLMTLLPCPIHMDYQYEMEIRVYNGGSGLLSPKLSKPFKNEMRQWASLINPMALIPIPGESDLPKISGTLFNIPRLERLFYEGIAGQIATATAQLVMKAEPEFWTQPRRAAPAIMQPSGTSTPAGSLVLPTETTLPF